MSCLGFSLVRRVTSQFVPIFYRLKDKYGDKLRELQRIVDKDPRILDGLPPLYREAALRLLQEEKRDTEQGRGQ